MSEFWHGKQAVYSPLNTAVGEIRLLTLLPAKFGTEICIKLTTEKLEKSSSLDYEALSYTWGSAENPIFIRVNDFDHLPVTRNLEEALQHLRYADQPRTLWIDAICVNQKDLDERSEQVPRMADIFASAKRVVVWLGPTADQSSAAIRTLKKIGSMIVVELFKGWMEPSEEAKETGELQWADRSADIPLAQIEFVQILNFFNRPWFERLWIRQEVRLATHLILICGLEILSWNHFLNAVFCLEAKKPAYSYRLGQYEDDWFQRVTLVWGLCGSSLRQDFPAQVDIAKYSKCSDPRDRVYALLSTSDMATHGIQISPNYRKSVDEVYQEVFLEFAKGYQNSLMSLYILTAAETKDFSLNRPTWVPDWATVRLSYLFPIFKACGMSYSKVTYIGEGILKTWGVMKSTIKTAHLSGLTQDPCPVDDIINSIRQLSRQALLILNEGLSPEKHINSGDQQWIATICGILFCDRLRDDYDPPLGDRLERDVCEEAIRTILTAPDIIHWPKQFIPHVKPVLSNALKYLLHRSVLLSTDGQIGVGPALSAVGDGIMIMPGCTAPMVVRSSANGRYRVVGECYFENMMNGEAFLGPLPEHYKVISKRVEFVDDSALWLNVYRDTRSGIDQQDDPRFDPSRHRLLTGTDEIEFAKGSLIDDDDNSTVLMVDSMFNGANHFQVSVDGLKVFLLE